jgi:hypothetical protein
MFVASLARKLAQPRGEQCYQAKLTARMVIEAKRRTSAGEKITSVAQEFGVARKTIADAIIGRTWKHLA